MHELAIAQQIVRTVLAEMERRGATAVRSVDIEIGELDGLRRETLRSAFLSEAEGTPLEGATLHVTVLPAKAICPACQGPKDVDLPWDPAHGSVRISCPDCGADLEIVGVRGVQILRATMVLEDP